MCRFESCLWYHYGELLAGYLGSPGTAENLSRTALLLEGIDRETAIAPYIAFKRMHGLDASDSDDRLRPLLRMIGERDGRAVVEGLLAEYPGGFGEIGSLMHGWGTADAEGCLEWINRLPEGSRVYTPAMKGLFWSVGVRGPAYAGDAVKLLDFETMSPEELDLVGESIAGAMIQNHGSSGFDEWLNALPESLRLDAIQWSLWRENKRPVDEIVPWLGEHAKEWTELNSKLVSRASDWARGDPDAAISWCVDYISEGSSNDQTERLLGAVAVHAGPEPMVRWMQENPYHPTNAILTGLLSQ